MSSKRKKYSAQGKVGLLRLHLIEKEPVSDICDRCGLNPNVFYRWQKLFFENGFGGFELIGRVVRMVFGPETGFSAAFRGWLS